MENIIKPATAEVKKNKRRKKPAKPTTQVVESKEINVTTNELPIIVKPTVSVKEMVEKSVTVKITKPKTLIQKIKAWFTRK